MFYNKSRIVCFNISVLLQNRKEKIMSIAPVSSVNFRGYNSVAFKANEEQVPEQAQEKKKGSKTGKVLLGLTAAGLATWGIITLVKKGKLPKVNTEKVEKVTSEAVN